VENLGGLYSEQILWLGSGRMTGNPDVIRLLRISIAKRPRFALWASFFGPSRLPRIAWVGSCGNAG